MALALLVGAGLELLDGDAGPAPSTTSTTPTTQRDELAPVATGVMSQGPPDPAHGYVDHVTGGTSLTWRDLERADQVFRGPGWRRLRVLLADPRVRSVRLRVYAGRNAPDFVKALGGPPRGGERQPCATGGIAVRNPYDGVGGCVPYFWTAPVLDQYEQLMREVARRHGDHPKLAEVVASACTTIYAEPFYRAHGHRASNQRLWDAGLDRATDEACQDRALAIHENALPRQRVSLAVNPWEIVVDPSTDRDGRLVDWAATHAFARRWRNRLGSRLVLQNNGWGESDGCPAGATPDTDVYCFLRDVAPPKGFQSETWRRLGASSGGDSATGWLTALERAIDLGACFVESTDNGYRRADAAAVARLDRRLAANCDEAPTSGGSGVSP